eukprot:g113.t1
MSINYEEQSQEYEGVNDDGAEPVIPMSSETAKKYLSDVFQKKERHKEKTIGGGGYLAGQDLTQDDVLEHKNVFSVYHAIENGSLDISKMSRADQKYVESKYFNTHGGIFYHMDQEKGLKYEKVVNAFKKLAFGAPRREDLYDAWKKLIEQFLVGARGTKPIGVRICDDATKEEREKIFNFLMAMSYYTRFLATKVEICAARQFKRDFYSELMEGEQNHPTAGIHALNEERNNYKRKLNQSIASYEAEKDNDRAKKKRRLSHNSVETRDKITRKQQFDREQTHYEAQIRKLDRAIDEKVQVRDTYRNRRSQIKTEKKALPTSDEWREQNVALYLCMNTKMGVKPFIAELVRSQDDLDVLNKVDFCKDKVNGTVHDKVTTYPYDGKDRLGKVIKLKDDGWERTLDERRAKALSMAKKMLEGQGYEEIQYDVFYDLPGMERPTKDGNSIDTNEYENRMGRGDFQRFASDGSSASNNGGMMMGSTTTTTTSNRMNISP